MIEGFAFGILAITLAGGLGDRLKPILTLIPTLALVAIALLGVLQLIPNTSLSPKSAEVYGEANAVLRVQGHSPAVPRISLAPDETKATILLTLAYAALFTSSAILMNSRSRRRWLGATLFITMTAHVLVSAYLSGATDRLHGAFVNPNHLAGYLEIGLAFAFGLIWAEVLTGRDRLELVRDAGERLEKRSMPFVWRILLWGILAAGIALTRSRGGVIAAVITTVALLAIGLMRRRGERAAILTIVAIALGMVFVFFAAGEASFLRILSSSTRDLSASERVLIWRGSIESWQMFPHFGDGLGAFKEAFRRVQPKEIDAIVDQAHNDFLQLLVTGGWIGALLGVIAFGSAFVILFRGWLQQQHREESAFVLAGCGAIFSLALHGIVEFNMSLPAIPATLAIMTGAAVAAARHRSN